MQSKCNQYGIKHSVIGTIHITMGDMLINTETEIPTTDQ